MLQTQKAIASLPDKKGINKGDRIAIFSENRHEWCASYLGIMMAGAIAVPIDSQLNPESVRNLLIDSESRIVFFSSKTEANVNEAAAGLDVRKINLDSPDFKEICGFTIEAVRYPETSPEDIASIIYTSGTTGIPKGVMLTHRNFCSDADALIKGRRNHKVRQCPFASASASYLSFHVHIPCAAFFRRGNNLFPELEGD